MVFGIWFSNAAPPDLAQLIDMTTTSPTLNRQRHPHMRTRSLLLFIASALLSTASIAAQTGQDCASRSQQVAVEKREDFLQTCLKQVSAPENVRVLSAQKKRETCEQNAKNLHLNPGSKPSYVSECLHRNEAAEAANKLSTSTPPQSTLTRPQPDRTAQPPRTSCAKQARAQKLKGEPRKKFMRECRQGR